MPLSVPLVRSRFSVHVPTRARQAGAEEATDSTWERMWSGTRAGKYYQNFGNSTDATDYVGDLIAYASTIYDAELETNSQSASTATVAVYEVTLVSEVVAVSVMSGGQVATHGTAPGSDGSRLQDIGPGEAAIHLPSG